MVMTFGPVMGVTKNRLLQFAPAGKFNIPLFAFDYLFCVRFARKQ